MDGVNLNSTEKKTNVTMDRSAFIKLALSLLFPLLILAVQPLGMDLRQSAVVSSILLVIIWWSTSIVKSIPASLFLLAVFCLVNAAPLNIVFTFPLSENFFLITLTYLFSQGIANSGIVEKLFEPVLMRFSDTPIKTLLSIIVMYTITIYMIPQPLARLIIIAMLFHRFLYKTTVPEETKNVLMFACFIFYAVVNMATKNADIIMNNASVAFAGLEMTDGQWIRYMAVPVMLYGALIFALFCFLFRKQLMGIKLTIADSKGEKEKLSLSEKEKQTLAVILLTVILWMTGSIHGINSTLVTLCSVLVLFALKILGKKDFSAIDIKTLIFLTAAFSIGGVMKACGAADIVFSKLQVLFPERYSSLYLVTMIFVGMLMHLILGSNTTALSVVIPGLIVVCGNVLPTEIIMFIAFNSVAFHSILPFHSAAIMIGASNGYFPAKYVARLGIPVTFLVYISTMFIFVPWWKFMGFM